MDIDRAVAAVVVVAPDFIEQRLAGEDAPPVVGQQLEQLVLLVGQLDDIALHGNLAGLQVYRQAVADYPAVAVILCRVLDLE